MLHESAAFSGVLSHSCPPRRATRSVVLSHKISTPPACWPGESKFSSGQLSTQSSAKNTVESRNARCWCASCPRVERLRFWVPRMDWIVSANEMNAEPVPNASPIRKFSRREYYILPLSFLALLIFPSNAGQAAAGAGGRTLRENSGSARESAGNNRKEGVHVAAAPAPFLVNGAAGALAAMAQTKVKRLLAHSSIGHVGYIRTGFSCGTIEGIQSLLIGIFIYALMTIDAFAIVLALRQTRVKYIADLGALAKTNPISAITFSITMFSYAGIPPLAGFCSKFYLFFAALGCGAYFLAPVGVVTSVIGRWAAGRLPRVSQFGGPKAVLRAPDT
ncbi:proton antipo M domain-containing protein [Citrus sinensis]|uniref:Proton antipo M domain-containing protein n=1 Tax=Citrus sinensis TaxID=2711 RepID=A0ACB8HYZ7_CITSI|nr:proton antipo M domain-containing protein [Citrus sinensis]